MYYVHVCLSVCVSVCVYVCLVVYLGLLTFVSKIHLSEQE